MSTKFFHWLLSVALLPDVTFAAADAPAVCGAPTQSRAKTYKQLREL